MRIAHSPITRFALAAILVIGPGAGVAMAGKGGPTRSTSTSSVSLVLLDSADGVPNFAETVTFNVTTTADMPMVNLTCYQNGDWVKNQTAGFYPGYAWSKDFPLSSWKWTGGAADCTATLYHSTRKGDVTLASLNFLAEA